MGIWQIWLLAMLEWADGYSETKEIENPSLDAWNFSIFQIHEFHVESNEILCLSKPRNTLIAKLLVLQSSLKHLWCVSFHKEQNCHHF